MKIISRTVWVLSFVSMFADVASEMLYPVVPVYLKEIGFSVFLIGVLEGMAEFTAGLSKGYFGKKSDEKGLRLPFVKGGYFLSAVSKPMMALFTLPAWIFLARTVDRLGKGLRTAARDALLSREATPATRSRVFALHRGMDTMGAVLGPLLALGFLTLFPGRYRTLFYWAFIPGIVAVMLVFLLREKKEPVSTLRRGNFFSFFAYWKIAGPEYRRLVAGLVAFALINSSDVFLLLKTREITGSDTTTIAAYVFYNLVYALGAYPSGVLADRFGKQFVFLAGLLLFAAVYAGFAFAGSALWAFGLFFVYGMYGATTEGIAKAWITGHAARSDTATAVGLYTSCQSVAALLASVLAGFVWMRYGSFATFAATAGLTVMISAYFFLFRNRM